MAGENTVNTMNGWFKEAYAKAPLKLVPEATYLMKNIKFNPSDGGLGNVYHQPVVLTMEHGITYAAGKSGAFALNAAVASVLQDAQVEGTQLLLRSRIDYETAARAAQSKVSFGSATELLVENMLESISKRLEIMFLHGRSATGIGTVKTTTAASTSFVVADAEWAPALWAGMENAKIDVFAPAYATLRGTYTIASVNLETQTITLTAAATLTANDVIAFAGAVIAGAPPTYNECAGMDAIIDIGTGTNLFGINPQAYTLWKGSVYDVAGAMTVTKVLKGLLVAIGKGLLEDVVLLVSPAGFQSLVNPAIDPAAAGGVRKVDASYNGAKLEVGSDNAVIRGNQGKITLVPHLFVKQGYAYAVSLKHFKRVGATDITFNTPGRGDEFFLQLQDAAGYELRVYANQGLFCDSPGRLTKFKGITNA
jgi:hypothetical protein